MTTGLLDWLDAPSASAGLRFLGDDGAWETVPYPALAGLVRATARDLRERGLTTGQVVVILRRTGPGFAAAFFGTLAAGGTPAPLAPPAALGDARRWREHAAHVIAESGAALVLADRDLAGAAAAAGPACAVLAPATARDAPPGSWTPAETALLQFTSGSRGRVRGVRVSRGNLEANIAMIGRRWAGRAAGTGVPWLPLHHDLGLIFGLLTPVVRGEPVALMRPEQFVQQPLRWLREHHGRSGLVMLMPNFGLEYIVRRVRPERLGGLDLSGVEAVVTGAERVRLDAAAAFLDLLGPCGLRPSALRPAYGLAEATLGVTCAPLGRAARAVAVAPGPLRMGEPLPLLGSAELSPRAPSGPGTWHVGCGTPLDGLAVRIVDDAGRRLPDGTLGEITVTGPSVALGHTSEQEDRATRFEDGVLLTGDAGFMIDGELYVVGRIGDSLQVRGRNVYVEDLEAVLTEEGLLTRQRTAVLAGYLDDDPVVCVLTAAPSAEGVVACLAPLVGPDVTVRVVRVKAGAIELTSSGKPRRRAMWRKLLAGEIDGPLLASSEPAEARR
ncbi:AMP-binding protein [Actinomadura sp. GTD37]|uniref:AMP-binding protein n=1 Tax=Actinomadura sp. GTD37 TaxID=1778030 RepID=UPI0035C233FC